MSWWNSWISLHVLAHWIQYFTPWSSLAAMSPGRLPTDIFMYLREEKQCFNSFLVQVHTSPQRSFPAEDRFPQRRIAIWALLHVKTNRRFQACFALLFALCCSTQAGSAGRIFTAVCDSAGLLWTEQWECWCPRGNADAPDKAWALHKAGSKHGESCYVNNLGEWRETSSLILLMHFFVTDMTGKPIWMACTSRGCNLSPPCGWDWVYYLNYFFPPL